MLEQRDLEGMTEQMDDFFDNLPLLPQFFYQWKKGAVTPGGTTFTTVFEAVPGFNLPTQADSKTRTPLGELVVSQNKSMAIPKRWGETVLVDDITYLGGIQINDMIVTQDGLAYTVTSKQTRGLGSFYVLDLELEKGYSNGWIEAQFPS